MKQILLLVLMIFCFSCGNKKVLQLPEIDHSEITEIKDVSHAYLFYDETQPDSVELNRKNLISTTNWLINVDKRLTLKQAIPHIKFLQSKKKSSSHKNKNAKNYFTCHDTSRQNLGFLEFTNIIFHHNNSLAQSKIDSLIINEQHYGLKKHENLKGIFEHVTMEVFLYFEKDNTIYANYFGGRDLHLLQKRNINDYINSIFNFINPLNVETTLNFNGDLSFQQYIAYKKYIESFESNKIKVSNNEFILN